MHVILTDACRNVRLCNGGNTNNNGTHDLVWNPQEQRFQICTAAESATASSLRIENAHLYGTSRVSSASSNDDDDDSALLSVLILITKSEPVGVTPLWNIEQEEEDSNSIISLHTVRRVCALQFIALTGPLSGDRCFDLLRDDDFRDEPAFLAASSAAESLIAELTSGSLHLYFSTGSGNFALALQQHKAEHHQSQHQHHRHHHHHLQHTQPDLFQFNRHCQSNKATNAADFEAERKMMAQVVRGTFDVFQVGSSGTRCFVALIARQEPTGAGPRYRRRGLTAAAAVSSEHHSVANQFEIEQIVFNVEAAAAVITELSSFICFRGSVPLGWSQRPTLFDMKPHVHIHSPVVAQSQPTINVENIKNSISFSSSGHVQSPQARRMTTHFNSLEQRHGTKLRVLSMLSSRAHEARLASDYRKYAEESGHDVRDFDTAYLLWKTHVDETLRTVGEDAVSESNLFKAAIIRNNSETKTVELTSRQQIALRINCLDVLDRTGLAQAAICVKMLSHQLASLDNNSEQEQQEREQALREFKFRLVSQSSVISTQYAGTSALFGNVVINGRGGAQMRFGDAFRGLVRFAHALWGSSAKHDADVFLVGRSLRAKKQTRWLLWHRTVLPFLHFGAVSVLLGCVWWVVRYPAHSSLVRLFAGIAGALLVRIASRKLELLHPTDACLEVLSE